MRYSHTDQSTSLQTYTNTSYTTLITRSPDSRRQSSLAAPADFNSSTIKSKIQGFKKDLNFWS